MVAMVSKYVRPVDLACSGDCGHTRSIYSCVHPSLASGSHTCLFSRVVPKKAAAIAGVAQSTALVRRKSWIGRSAWVDEVTEVSRPVSEPRKGYVRQSRHLGELG